VGDVQGVFKTGGGGLVKSPHFGMYNNPSLISTDLVVKSPFTPLNFYIEKYRYFTFWVNLYFKYLIFK